MQPEPTDQRRARRLALAASILAATSLAYTAALCVGDWLATEILAGTSAQAGAHRLCTRLKGCVRASISSGFDWRHARRSVLLRVEEQPNVELSREEALKEIRSLTSPASGLALSWALRAEPVLALESAHAERREGTSVPGGARR